MRSLRQKNNQNNIETFSYAKLILELVKLCNKHNMPHKIIGYENFEKIGMVDPIYRILIHPKARINFCIVAGVQAYEIAGPLTMLCLLNKPNKYLNKRIRYYIYPMINPTSFDLRQRNDDDNRDLNTLNKKTLKSKNFKEVKYFYDDIKNIHFNAFLSLHEDVDEKRFYTYVFESGAENPVYRQIIKAAMKYAAINEDRMICDDPSNRHGLLINIHDQSYEDFLFSHRKADISLCTETPGLLPLKTRIKINLQTIKILSEYLLK